MKRTMLTMAAWLIGTAALAADAGALLSQGKLHADLGRREQAAAAFQAVAEDPTATREGRAEALIRLGLVRRELRDEKGAAQAFETVWTDYRQHKEVVAQLVQALTGALPAGPHWDANWQKAALLMNPPRLVWASTAPGPRTYKGKPISMETKDGDLQDVFRLFADVSGLNVVVFPRTQGKLTYTAHEVPWDQALHDILAPHGLDYRWEGNVLTIARPEQLGTARTGSDPERVTRYAGAPIDVDLKNLDLRGTLVGLAATGGADVSFQPLVNGGVTIKLHQVPWDQAFDVVVAVNGLAWTRQGKVLAVHGRKAAPGQDQQSTPPARLEGVALENAQLRGIVKSGAEYKAFFACPERTTGSGSAGSRLQDAEIKTVDATSVTFRKTDGTESRQSLYPSSR